MRRWLNGLTYDEIWLSGAGSSDYVGQIIARELEARAPKPVRAVPSTDLVADPRLISNRTPLVVSFGRSGRSAETRGVLAALDALAPQVPRLHITCNRDSPLARPEGERQRSLVLPEASHDKGFAMTASFTTLLLSGLSLLDPRADLWGEIIEGLAVRADDLLPRLSRFVRAQALPSRLVFVGSGPLLGAARESALKALELSAGAVPTLAETTLGLRHGPKSFIHEGTLVVTMHSARAQSARYDHDLAEELAQQFPKSPLLRLGPQGDFDCAPGGSDGWNAVLYVLFAQIYAYHLALKLGLDVDDPFAGKGTLSRVVDRVRLYDPAL